VSMRAICSCSSGSMVGIPLAGPYPTARAAVCMLGGLEAPAVREMGREQPRQQRSVSHNSVAGLLHPLLGCSAPSGGRRCLCAGDYGAAAWWQGAWECCIAHGLGNPEVKAAGNFSISMRTPYLCRTVWYHETALTLGLF